MARTSTEWDGADDILEPEEALRAPEKVGDLGVWQGHLSAPVDGQPPGNERDAYMLRFRLVESYLSGCGLKFVRGRFYDAETGDHVNLLDATRKLYDAFAEERGFDPFDKLLFRVEQERLSSAMGNLLGGPATASSTSSSEVRTASAPGAGGSLAASSRLVQPASAPALCKAAEAAIPPPPPGKATEFETQLATQAWVFTARENMREAVKAAARTYGQEVADLLWPYARDYAIAWIKKEDRQASALAVKANVDLKEIPETAQGFQELTDRILEKAGTPWLADLYACRRMFYENIPLPLDPRSLGLPSTTTGHARDRSARRSKAMRRHYEAVKADNAAAAPLVSEKRAPDPMEPDSLNPDVDPSDHYSLVLYDRLRAFARRLLATDTRFDRFSRWWKPARRTSRWTPPCFPLTPYRQ